MATFLKIGGDAFYNVECIETILLVDATIQIKMKDGKTFVESWQDDEDGKIARKKFQSIEQNIREAFVK